MDSEATTEAEEATEANAAAVGRDSAALQTHRQQDHPSTSQRRLFHRALAAGIRDLEKKASNALLTVLSTNLSPLPKGRETTTGADVSERGDPLLLIIIFQKRFVVRSRRNYSTKMVDRWGRRDVDYATNISSAS